MPLHRSFNKILITGLFSLCAWSGAQAQSFPQKPVSLMVPFPAGGVSDIIARLISEPLAKQLGQTVVVENVGGANGAIAAQKVLSAPADGYYLFQGGPNVPILTPLTNASVKFDSSDFRLVQIIGAAQIAFLARKDIPANSVDELLDYARKIAAEGKPLTYASVGSGSLYHLLGESLSKTTGIPMVHVPYRGAAPAETDLIGGRVDIFLAPFGKKLLNLQGDGRLKILAMLNKERLDGIKQIPAISESKQIKDFEFTIWTGYFAKKGTPEPVLRVLHEALTTTLSDPKVRTGLESTNLLVAQPMTQEALDTFYGKSIAQFRAIAESIDLQPQ